MVLEECAGRRTNIRLDSRQNFIHDQAQTVEVGLGRQFRVIDLLWSKVSHRTKKLSRSGNDVRIDDFGDTKVGQIRIILMVEQEVIRLDVPVNHAVSMG